MQSRTKAYLILSLILLVAMPAFSAEKFDIDAWHQNVTEVLRCEIKAEEGDAILRVELERPDEKNLLELVDKKSGAVRYVFQDQVLPLDFYPGKTIIKKFDFEWEGKKIEIPQRFWNDLAGLVIQKSPLKVDELPDGHRHLGVDFLAELLRPRLSISLDQGTVLIEWDCPAECDSRTTIRWIIGKSGAVMRHRYSPPHEC